MKRYQIFKHPAGDTEAIPEGWNWMAFLFGPIWALCHSLWGVGIGFSVGTFVLAYVGIETIGRGAEILMNLVMIVTAVIFGSNGNAWRAARQHTNGYELVDAVEASNAEAALVLAFPSAQLPRQDESNNPPA